MRWASATSGNEPPSQNCTARHLCVDQYRTMSSGKLGDRDGVRKAKTEMFAHRRPGASIILNGDDDKLSEIATVHAASFSKQDGTTVVPYSDSTHDETSAASAVANPGIRLLSSLEKIRTMLSMPMKFKVSDSKELPVRFTLQQVILQ